MSIFQGLGRAIYALNGGAITAQIPDSTAAGGNARGANAVDLQTSRTGASRVASGQEATVSGGIDNSATQLRATVSGGGDNQATGSYSWIPGGFQATASGQYGKGAWASGRFAVAGDAQAGEYMLRRQTTDATPTRLTADNAAAGANNTVNLPNNSTYRARVMVVGRQNTAGGGRYSVEQSVLIVRDANAASTTVTTGAAEVLTTGTVTGWAVALTADTTNGGLAITVTGAAATTINWVARVMSVEVVA